MLAAVPRKKQDPELPGLVQTNFRTPQSLLDGLDEIVRDLNRDVGWAKHNRSELMREILERAIEEHRKKRGSAR